MKLQNLFLIFGVFFSSFNALGDTNVFYLDSAGLERKTDWKIYQTFIWKKFGAFKTLEKQTWIALPPLLELSGDEKHISIFPNTKENNSPFVNDKNIKKVLVLEHQRPRVIVPLIKTAAIAGNASVGLRIEDTTFKPHSAVSERCQSLGLNLDLLKSRPYLLSMDCKKETHFVKVLVGFSGTLQSIEALGGEILTSQPGSNHVVLHYKEDPEKGSPKRLVANLSVQAQGKKKNEVFSLVFQSPNKSRGDVIRVTTEDGAQGLKSTQDANSTLKAQSTKLKLGLLSSKIGLEAYSSADFFIDSKQSIGVQISFPFNYFSIKKNDRSYLDATVNYSRHWSYFSFGTGVRLVELHDDQRRPFSYGSIFGWNLRVASEPWIRFDNGVSVSSALSYTPLAFDQVIKMQRARFEIMDFTVYHSQEGRLAGLLYYDLLEIDRKPFKFYDYKFVGGVTYQW